MRIEELSKPKKHVTDETNFPGITNSDVSAYQKSKF